MCGGTHLGSVIPPTRAAASPHMRRGTLADRGPEGRRPRCRWLFSDVGRILMLLGGIRHFLLGRTGLRVHYRDLGSLLRHKWEVEPDAGRAGTAGDLERCPDQAGAFLHPSQSQAALPDV